MFVPKSNISDLWAGVAMAAAAIMFAAMLAPFIFAHFASALRRMKRKRGSLECIFMALLGVGAVMYGGAKGGGSVSYPRTNPHYELLRDAGSVVSNDTVTIRYTPHPILPPEADLQIWRRPLELTNDTDWVEHLATTVGAFPSPQTIDFPNAISNNWSVFTTWSPAPSVQTNGVLHALWRGTNAAPSRIDAIPLGTQVRENGFTIAPPERKTP